MPAIAAAGLDLLAEGFLYPDAERALRLRQPAQGMPATCRTSWTRFREAVARLAPAAWEELYTRTLDLNPLAAPYVGYQLYGEDYRRGALMATLSREHDRLGVATDGELADHLTPVLRYLARAEAPDREVVDATVQALATMAKQLETLDHANPYRHLVRAARAAVGEFAAGRTAP